MVYWVLFLYALSQTALRWVKRCENTQRKLLKVSVCFRWSSRRHWQWQRPPVVSPKSCTWDTTLRQSTSNRKNHVCRNTKRYDEAAFVTPNKATNAVTGNRKIGTSGRLKVCVNNKLTKTILFFSDFVRHSSFVWSILWPYLSFWTIRSPDTKESEMMSSEQLFKHYL